MTTYQVAAIIGLKHVSALIAAESPAQALNQFRARYPLASALRVRFYVR